MAKWGKARRQLGEGGRATHGNKGKGSRRHDDASCWAEPHLARPARWLAQGKLAADSGKGVERAAREREGSVMMESNRGGYEGCAKEEQEGSRGGQFDMVNGEGMVMIRVMMVTIMVHVAAALAV